MPEDYDLTPEELKFYRMMHNRMMSMVDEYRGEMPEKGKEVSPPGWEGVIKAMKKHPEITNPYALAWWMKGQGYTPHR